MFERVSPEREPSGGDGRWRRREPENTAVELERRSGRSACVPGAAPPAERRQRWEHGGASRPVGGRWPQAGTPPGGRVASACDRGQATEESVPRGVGAAGWFAPV